MSGVGHHSTGVPGSGNILIDGLLAGSRWTDAVITYGFSSSTDDYGAGYPSNFAFLPTYSPMSTQQREAVSRIMDADHGDGSYAAFSFEGLTNASVAFTSSPTPHIRAANADAAPYGYGFFPAGGRQQGGDFWIGDNYEGTSYDARNPIVGNYSFMLHIHEIGHALGLHHPHHGSDDLPHEFDAYEFTVMSYNSYPDGPHAYRGGGNEFPQSFMMLDIQALQYLYGANFSINSGDTVYSWTPDNGDTVIDGQIAISPGTNRIFATVWDGGGIDTYDLSAYDSNLSIDLRPGESSQFSQSQTANLGDGHFAQGNIYNALQYQGDTRSLIENAIGGSGHDTITGNAANNEITGGGGDDVMSGGAGQDIFVFELGHGNDVILDFSVEDIISVTLSPYLDWTDLLSMMTEIAFQTVEIDFGLGGTLRLEGISLDDLTPDNFMLTAASEDGFGPFLDPGAFTPWEEKSPPAQKPQSDPPVSKVLSDFDEVAAEYPYDDNPTGANETGLPDFTLNFDMDAYEIWSGFEFFALL